jgi:sodium/pantothenate symporter
VNTTLLLSSREAAIFAEAAGIDPVLGLLLFGLLTVFYTTFGGFRAVAWTDFVCAVLMIVGMVMLGWAVIGEAGGLTAAMERAAAAQLADPSADLSSSPIFSPNANGALPWTLLFSAWILVGFGTAGLPQSAVRCMSYQSSADLHRAMIVSTIVCGALMIGEAGVEEADRKISCDTYFSRKWYRKPGVGSDDRRADEGTERGLKICHHG